MLALGHKALYQDGPKTLQAEAVLQGPCKKLRSIFLASQQNTDSIEGLYYRVHDIVPLSFPDQS